MAPHVPEPDWRVFRELRELALERFYRRVLDEVERLAQDSSRSRAERYRDIYRLFRKRDRALAHAFDDPRRSTMIWQLAAIHHDGLLEPEEFARFSDDTRRAIELLAKE